MADELLCTIDDVVGDWPAFGNLAPDVQQRLINVASQRILDFCRRRFVQAPYDEFYSGKNTGVLWLRQKPVISIEQVIVNGEILESVRGPLWTLKPKSGKLVRGPGLGDERFAWFWPRGTNNIEIQYTAGFSEVPDPVNQAAIWMVRYLNSAGKLAGGLYQSESIGDYSYTLNPTPTYAGMPSYIADLLMQYVQDDGPV